MTYIDLSAIKEEHLNGTWEVTNRVVNNNAASNPFIDIRMIEMNGEKYRSVNGKERKGEWQMIREQEIIYNPQIKFFLDRQQVGNAIITRLLSESYLDGETYKLTLYFSNGLELILKKTAVKLIA